MSKNKIVNVTQNQTNSNVAFILEGAVTKYSTGLIEKLITASNTSKTKGNFYLVTKDETAWKKLFEGDKTVLEAFNNGTLHFAKTCAEVFQKNETVFYLPIKNAKTPSHCFKLLSRLEKVNKNQDGLYILGKNTAKKQSVGGRFFQFMANFWARVLTGIDAKGLASGIIGFESTTYIQLTERFGAGTSPIVLMKLAKEQGMNIDFIDGDYDEPAYGFGAAFSAIVKGKWTVATYIVKNYFTDAVKQIKTNGIRIVEKNSAFYKIAFGTVATLVFAVMMSTSTDYNITWDEPNHNTFAKDVLSYYTTLGSDTTMFDFNNRDYQTNVLYGMSFDTFCAGIQQITGLHEYDVRRVGNALIGFLCLLLTSLLAKHFFGWRAALLAMLAMFLSPSFYGHAFNNPKDIPLAMGYVMTALFLVRLLSEMPKPRMQTMFMLALAIGFSISIRASGLVQIGFVLAFLGLHWLFAAKEKGKVFKQYLFIFIGVALVGYIIGVLSWPYALRNPLTGPITAFKEFSNFAYLNYYELFEGVRIKDKPWYYEPKLIALTAPLMVLAGLAFFALTVWFNPAKPKGEVKSAKDIAKTLGLWVLLIMTFAPSAYAIYKNSYVYNGWRHFLFIYPTLVVLAIWGWEKLMMLLSKVKITQILIPLVAIALLVPAGIFSIKNHPYQYLYFNEIAGGVEGAAGEYELDYWCQTPREAYEWLQKNVPAVKDGKATVASNNIVQTLSAHVPNSDSLKYLWCRENEWFNNPFDYAIFTNRTLSKTQIKGGYWPPKGTIHEIKVGGVCVAAVVKAENNYGGQANIAFAQRNIAEAEALYTQAVLYNPKEEEFARGLAGVLKAKGQMDSAILFFNKAAALRDHNFEAFFGLGECYFTQATRDNQNQPNLNLLSKAEENFRKAIEFKQNYSSAYYYLGNIQLIQKKEYDAEKTFLLAIEQSPNFSYAYTGLGKAYMNSGRADKAIESFTIAIQIDEQTGVKNPEPYYYLSQMYRNKGDETNANAYAQKYMQMAGGGATQ